MSLAKNTIIKIGDAGSPTEVFTQIAKCTEVAWDGVSWSTEKTTNHDSATPVETMVPTIYSNGSIKITINPYSAGDTQHALLRSLSLSGAARNFQLVHVDSTETAAFSGYVTSFAYETPVDGELKAKVTIMINGAFTIS